jgi:hypothetical protein
MKVKKQTERISEKLQETESSEDLELLNKKRKLQNKVLQKMIEDLDNQSKEESANNKKKR